MNNGTLLRHFLKHFSEEIFGKYPPSSDFGKVFKCTLCDKSPKEFDGSGKKPNYIRHVGAVHRKVIDFLSPEDFRSPQNDLSTPRSAKEIRCPKCDEVFATKALKTLHSCDSLLSKNGISEEGQERSTRVSVDFNEENEQEDIQLAVNRKRHSSTADSDSKMSEEPLTKVSKTNSNTTNANECDAEGETEADEAEMNNEEELELRLERDDNENDNDDDGDNNDDPGSANEEEEEEEAE